MLLTAASGVLLGRLGGPVLEALHAGAGKVLTTHVLTVHVVSEGLVLVFVYLWLDISLNC